mgnify:CR=1 FL=1|tara:strand:+ start:4623 stop:4787 length:165 start_codon:yes stop_codon:yes gene_type:complete
MNIRKSIVKGLGSQIEEHLEQEYKRGWDDAMKYAQREEKRANELLQEKQLDKQK